MDEPLTRRIDFEYRTNIIRKIQTIKKKAFYEELSLCILKTE